MQKVRETVLGTMQRRTNVRVFSSEDYLQVIVLLSHRRESQSIKRMTHDERKSQRRVALLSLSLLKMAVETSDSLRSRTPASKAKVSNPNESPSVQKSTKNSQKSKTTTAVAAVERNVFLALSFCERQLKQIANRVFPFLQMWFQWIWTQWIPAGVKNRASKFVTKHRDIL